MMRDKDEIQGIGRYQFIKQLGDSGFSTVYLAIDTSTGEQVVVKVFKKEPHKTGKLLNTVFTEVNASNLQHPNIMRARAFYIEGDSPYQVMDYISKGSLRDQHPAGTKVAQSLVIEYVKQICGALQYAHNNNIIHCDIKPENMLLTDTNQVLVADFGISTHTAMQSAGHVLGTIKYMSPEHFRGNPTKASDQYSLAVMVYEWLCGRPPFEGTSSELIRQHANEKPHPINEWAPEISEHMDVTLQHALRKDPEQRYQSMEEFAQALEHAAGAPRPGTNATTPTPVTPVSQTGPFQAPPGRKTSNPVPASVPSTPIPPKVNRAPLTPSPAPIATPQKPYVKGGWNRVVMSLFAVALVLVLLLGSVVLLNHFIGGSGSQGIASTSTPTGQTQEPVPSTEFNVMKAPDGETIGTSIGGTIFDTSRPDLALKTDAAAKFRAADYDGAMKDLSAAATDDTNDAEALIYLENLRIMHNKHMISLFVGTTLTGSSVDTGRDILQGAYVAQKEFNDACKTPDCLQVRLIIANAGTGDSITNGIAYATVLMEQMVIAARADTSITGVMGWPISSLSSNSDAILGSAHLPIVSPTALIPTDAVPSTPSTSDQSQRSSFSVAPSIESQGTVDASYALHQMGARSVVVLTDPVDPYSQALADAFSTAYTGRIASTLHYTTGKPETLLSIVTEALAFAPDLIYFAGNSLDASALLTDMGSCEASCPHVLGGDALYGNYSPSALGNLHLVSFTSFSYPDEWSIKDKAHTPPFFDDYPQAFDPHSQHLGNPYGYTRPDNNVILAYDAMKTLITAGANASQGTGGITSATLASALLTIKGDQALQGASGLISFDNTGSVSKKIILVLQYNSEQKLGFVMDYGCLTQFVCN